jgi:uncharacterized SAM-dependent methyltransferase
VTIDLIDVSSAALAHSERTLAGIGGAFVRTHLASYEAGLRELPERAEGGRLALFLGSNIGNFDPDAARDLLEQIGRALRPGDGLLLGVDLVKPEAELLLAYDDPLGVTAAFNKNVLLRINHELGGRFDLDGFAHRAVWNAEASRVEMHLVSRRARSVAVEGLGTSFRFAEGESIWTESSYKYTPAGIVDLLHRAGFACDRTWIDESVRFATCLSRVLAG